MLRAGVSLENYLMDTCAWLDLHRRHYAKEVFASLWEQIDALIAAGRVSSHREVLKELERGDDEVAAWAKDHVEIFTPPGAEEQERLRELLAEFPKLADPTRTKPHADPFLVARAVADRLTIVTSESHVGSVHNPTLPFVCRAKGVKHVNLLTMFRDLGWQF
jgi:hypothetical protein